MGTITAALGMLASSLATNPWILTVTYGFIVGKYVLFLKKRCDIECERCKKLWFAFYF